MAAIPVRIHGARLAAGASLANLTVEVLAADPVPLGPGRLWFNSSSKQFKFSSLNGTGGVITRAFYSAEEAEAALAALRSDLEAADAAEAAARAAGDAATLESAKAYTDAAEAAGKAYTDAAKAELLGGMPSELLDTIKELADALKNNPGIVDALETSIGNNSAAIAEEEARAKAAEADLAGDIADEVAARVAAVSGEAATRAAADAELDARISEVEGLATGNVGNLSMLTTDAKTDVVSAINEVDAHADAAASAAQAAASAAAAEATRAMAAESELAADLAAETSARASGDATNAAGISAEVTRAMAAEAAEATARAAGDAAIRSNYNDTIWTFQSTTSATSHLLMHGLASPFVDCHIWVEGNDGTYRADLVGIEEVDNNTIRVELSEGAKIKAVVRSAAAL